MPRIRWRVVCGLDETMEIFWPTNAFSRVDFPELGRPMITAVPHFMPAPQKTGNRRKKRRSGTAGILADTNAGSDFVRLCAEDNQSFCASVILSPDFCRPSIIASAPSLPPGPYPEPFPRSTSFDWRSSVTGSAERLSTTTEDESSPKTPLETSFATSRSRFLRSSFFCADSMRRSVSAAKPTSTWFFFCFPSSARISSV